MRTELSSREGERRIAELAARQHGVVALTQLLGLGLGRSAVKHRCGVGRLHRVHRGVYAVGHPRLSRLGRWMAATLIAPDVFLSDGTAAEALSLRTGSGAAIHISCRRRIAPRGPLIPHRRVIRADERTRVDGVPVTSLSRTLFDLAGSEGSRSLVRCLREAHFRRLSDRITLPELLSRYPRRRGAAIVRAALESGVYRYRLRSGLESDFLDFLIARRLPLPETNSVLELGPRRIEVDCLWRAEGIVVELDTELTHGAPAQRESDRQRDSLLQLGGFSVHRVSDVRFRSDPDGVERMLRRALGHPPS